MPRHERKRSKKTAAGGSGREKGRRPEGMASDREAKLRNICSYLRRYGRRRRLNAAPLSGNVAVIGGIQRRRRRKKESEIRTRYKEGELSLKVKAGARGSIRALRELRNLTAIPLLSSSSSPPPPSAPPPPARSSSFAFPGKKDPMILIPVIKSFSRRGRARVRLCYSRHE